MTLAEAPFITAGCGKSYRGEMPRRRASISASYLYRCRLLRLNVFNVANVAALLAAVIGSVSGSVPAMADSKPTADPILQFAKVHLRGFAAPRPEAPRPARCEGVINKIADGVSFRRVPHEYETTDPQDPRLAELNRCKHHTPPPQTSPRDFYDVTDVGDQRWRLYARSRVLPNAPPAQRMVFGQYSQEKVVLNYFFTGYNVIDVNSCEIISGATVQETPPPNSRRFTGNMPLSFAHGVYRSAGAIWVLSANVPWRTTASTSSTELYSFDAHELKPNGKFEPPCSWSAIESVHALSK